MRLGKGEKLDDIMKTMTAVAEGVLTSKSAHDLAKKKGIDCPVIEGIYKARSCGMLDWMIIVAEEKGRTSKSVGSTAWAKDLWHSVACNQGQLQRELQ